MLFRFLNIIGRNTVNIATICDNTPEEVDHVEYGNKEEKNYNYHRLY